MGTSPQNPALGVRVLPFKKKDDFVDFWHWLFPSARIKSKPMSWPAFFSVSISIAGGLLAVVYKAVEIKEKIQHPFFGSLTLTDFTKFSYLVQVAVIFYLLLRLAFVRIFYDDRFPFGNKGQDRIKLWWTVALFSFLFFYIFQWTQAQIVSKPDYSVDLLRVLRVLSNLCNNGSTLAFLMCYLAMEWPTKDRNRRLEGWVICWMGCLVMLTFLQVAFGNGPQAAAKEAFVGQIDWFDLLAGANAGIALAMFSGRISSPLIGPPVSVTALLYLYAILQISFGFWGEHKIVAFITANVCLVLKVLLALVITWLLSTRHLMFYMERMNLMRPQLDEWRKEIKERRNTPRPAKPRNLPNLGGG